jgi:hypothetical protein
MSRAAAHYILSIAALAHPCASQGPHAQRGDATAANATDHRHRGRDVGNALAEVVA